jgi:hypothetical protein
MAGVLLITSQPSTLLFFGGGRALWIWMRFGLSLFFLEPKDFFIITRCNYTGFHYVVKKIY